MSERTWFLEPSDECSAFLHYMREPTNLERPGFKPRFRDHCFIDTVPPVRIPGVYNTDSMFWPEEHGSDDLFFAPNGELLTRVSAWEVRLYLALYNGQRYVWELISDRISEAEEQRNYFGRFFFEEEAKELNLPYRDVPAPFHIEWHIPHYYTQTEYENIKKCRERLSRKWNIET